MTTPEGLVRRPTEAEQQGLHEALEGVIGS
jgi:hypothetical protein